jgi:2-hydroxychromene-2-carboxylate isomerase
LGVPLQLPEKFPFFGLAASRAFYWLDGGEKAKQLAKAVFHAAYGEGRDVTPIPTVAALAKNLGIEGLEQGIELPETKAKLRDATDQAIAAGIFGSPYFIVDDEAFWGHDRLAQVDRWLATGGW